MSQSHTGRNGTLFESGQTTTQRTKFNATMGPNGQNTDNLKAMFSGSPSYVADVAELNASGATLDRGGLLDQTDDTPFEAFRLAYTTNVVKGTISSGFGFANEDVLLDYSSGAPTFDGGHHGYAIPEKPASPNDLYSQEEIDTAGNGVIINGHPNLKVNGFQPTNAVSGSVQLSRNDDLPGSSVNNNRTTISSYFTGAGDRTS